MKIRANLSIDANLWDEARTFFTDNPQMGSISSLFEMTLRQFMDVMPDMVAKARAGDASAALRVLQRSHNFMNAEVSVGLNELEDAVRRQPALFPPVQEGKPKRAIKQKK